MAEDLFSEIDYAEMLSPEYPSTSAEEILSLPETNLEYLLSPVIYKGSRSLLYAGSGVGKTHFALAVGASVAGASGFGLWKRGCGGKVLYIDAEMGLQSIRRRLSHIVRHGRFEIPEGKLRFLCFDRCRNSIPPNIAEPRIQKKLDTIIEWADLVIFDNWCSLAWAFERKQTDFDLWPLFHAWNIKITSRGKATLMVHHAGKSGVYLGTSRMTQAMDVVLKLSRPADYNMSDGATFELHFEKGRDLSGEDLEPQLVKFYSTDDLVYWDITKLKDELPGKIQKLKDLGLSDRQICQELGIPLSKLLSLSTEFKDDGEVMW